MSIPSVILKMRQVHRVQRFDPEVVRRLQRRRWRRLLQHVLAKSRFYAEYYRAQGITADRLDGIELKDLPTIDKRMVMENFDALVCDSTITRAGIERFLRDYPDPRAKYRGRYHVVHTSGSTGSLGIFVYDQRAWDWIQALAATRVLRYRPTVGRIRYAFLLKTDGHHAGVKLCQSAPCLAFKRLALSVDAPLDQTLRQVHHFQPHLLGGYGSALDLVAQYQLAGRIHIRPKRIVSSGEPLTDTMKQTMVEAFGVVPLDLYAASESLVIGVSCRYDQGIHLFEDWHCLEIADDAGQPGKEDSAALGSGGAGRLILTNLYNYVQPLIRYEMNDELMGFEGRCPCGWPFPLIRRVAGRVEETLWFTRPDGTREYLHCFAIGGLYLPGVAKWQVVQTRPNELLLRLKLAAPADRAVRQAKDELTAILRHKHLERYVTVRTEIVAEIPNDPTTGKFRLVLPYPGRAISAHPEFPVLRAPGTP